MNRNTIKEKYKSKEKKTQKGKIEKKKPVAAIFLSFCSLSKYLSFFFFSTQTRLVITYMRVGGG